jgi:hypothetical protein
VGRWEHRHPKQSADIDLHARRRTGRVVVDDLHIEAAVGGAGGLVDEAGVAKLRTGAGGMPKVKNV